MSGKLDPVAAYLAAMQSAGVPHEPLDVYDSNSWRRVGLKSTYKQVVWPYTAGDGQADIAGVDVLRALVAAFNAMPVTLARIAELERIVGLNYTKAAYRCTECGSWQ